MSKNHEHHGHDSHGHHNHGHEQHRRRPPHKDWRLWFGVLLMLGAMVVYVMTREESIAPGQGAGQPMPAAP